MKIWLFILNAVSVILTINFLVANPTITGYAIKEYYADFSFTSPLGLSMVFIVVTIALDLYFYRKAKYPI